MVARLLEACHSSPRLQSVDIRLYESGSGEDKAKEDLKIGWEARMKVSLPKVENLTIPYVFEELDLGGCLTRDQEYMAG